MHYVVIKQSVVNSYLRTVCSIAVFFLLFKPDIFAFFPYALGIRSFPPSPESVYVEEAHLLPEEIQVDGPHHLAIES